MASPQRRFMLQKPVVVDVGCGCRRSIFSTLFSAPSSSSSSSSLKQRIPKSLSFSSLSSTTSSPAGTASPFSSSPSPATQATSGRKGEKQSLLEESVAVVKDSLNPYHDFYESMLVMIMEKEIYNWEDLCELLYQYLSLNSSQHHHIIHRAFADIWTNVFSPAGGVAGESMAAAGRELIACDRSGNGTMNSSYVIN